MTETTIERMECMEVWGGNRFTRRSLRKAGLDLWVYARPAGKAEQGGDVYYVSSCASGRVTRMLLADVSGHGQKVASISATLRDLMRRYINFISQARFVTAMNESFGAVSEESNFATAVVCTYFEPKGALVISNAGHPTPLLYHSAQGRWARCDRDASPALPLGVTEATQYDESRIKVAVGDVLLCYTDSLIEARDSSGGFLGVDGLLEIVQSLDVSDPDQFLDALLTKIDGLAPDNLAADDLTVLVARVNAESVSFRDGLLAPFRLMGDLLMRRRVEEPVQAAPAMR
jgi:serine phosphatase RsbU (regulator of sigma subunit)